VTTKHFVVATAGHVDHGKSALVKALTGMDPDRLPEEKAREITIDLGFAHLALPSLNSNPNAPTILSLSIIDVPGHEDFIRNMIAGLGSIDLALLVVAADDGWMPQTEEHLQILTYLGVKRLIVALNKSDVGNPDQVAIQIKQELAHTPFEDAPIIQTAARSGRGIDQLKEALVETLSDASPQPDIEKPRLLVDRVFTLPGIGSVVTGSLPGGRIRAGQQLYGQPGNFKTRARSLQTHRTSVDVAEPGMRTGVNLTDIPRNSSPDSLGRGCILTTEQFETSTTLDVVVTKSGRLHKSHPAARPIKSGTSVYLHHGTARIGAILVLSEEKPLQVGESVIGQLRLDSPVLAFIGDCFVIRDRSEQHTIAGGTVLDSNGDPKRFKISAQQQLLAARAAQGLNATICVESELVRRGPTRARSLLINSNFSPSEIESALTNLRDSRRIVVHGGIAADVKSWEALRQQAIAAIDRAHETNSEQKGLELTDLRIALSGYSPEVLDALLEELSETGFARSGSVIARASHQPRLPAQLEKTAQRILSALTERPLDPPARSRIATDPADTQALRYLIERGDVVELGADLVLSAEAFSHAKKVVSGVIASNGPATVSELREALQTSRRVAVPLLERLDRDRVTRRLGDRRALFLQSTAPVQSPAI
jgi:selenocysteine-specific elongation factor